jgi:hypothetical protein
VIGLQSSPQIEAWIPIFLFAMLFGLSMDYEVFLLSRMREEWDLRHDNEHAVAFVGLQEFGLGLSAAILLDATLVRAVLVPAVMKIMGDWNWYLPARVRRVLRVPATPARATEWPRSQREHGRDVAQAQRRRQRPGRELDDEGRTRADAHVLPARDAARPPAQASHGQPGELGVAAGRLRVAALGDVDQPEGLVVVEAERRLLTQDQVADRARLGLGPRPHSGAGPVLGRVAVEVDAVGVGALVVGEAVGVHVADEQQLRAGCRAGALKVGDDAATGGLVAVDAADDEDPARRVGRSNACDRDRAALHRVADDLGAHRACASVVTTAS